MESGISRVTLPVALQDSAEIERAEFPGATLHSIRQQFPVGQLRGGKAKRLAKQNAKIRVNIATVDDVAEILAVTRAAGEDLARRHGAESWAGGLSEGMERTTSAGRGFRKRWSRERAGR